MSGERLGPLHGIPTAIKDLFDSKPGWPTDVLLTQCPLLGRGSSHLGR
jgi:hypothetical protein